MKAGDVGLSLQVAGQFGQLPSQAGRYRSTVAGQAWPLMGCWTLIVDTVGNRLPTPWNRSQRGCR